MYVLNLKEVQRDLRKDSRCRQLSASERLALEVLDQLGTHHGAAAVDASKVPIPEREEPIGGSN